MCFHEPKSLRAALYCNSTHFPVITSDLLIPYKILIPASPALLPLSSMPWKYFCLWKSHPISARLCGHHSWWFWGEPGDTHKCGDVHTQGQWCQPGRLALGGGSTLSFSSLTSHRWLAGTCFDSISSVRSVGNCQWAQKLLRDTRAERRTRRWSNITLISLGWKEYAGTFKSSLIFRVWRFSL